MAKKKIGKDTIDIAKTKVPAAGGTDETKLKETPPDAVRVTSQSSVEITKDSKGQIKTTVKVYHDNPEEAAKLAEKIFKELEENLNVK